MVWHCRDIQSAYPRIMPDAVRINIITGNLFIGLKLFKRHSPKEKGETDACDRFGAFNVYHAGAVLVRTVLDVFQIAYTECIFRRLVHPLFGISLYNFRINSRAKYFWKAT
jgi:hypothetical protein